MQRFEGKTVIVTGAGQGLGKGIALRFLLEGAQVLAVDLNKEALTDLSSDDRLVTLAADVRAKDAPSQIISACVDNFGKIDVLVNNAGKGNAPRLEDTTDEIFDFYMDLNVRSVFRLSRDILPQLRRTRGNIVNMASNSALRGFGHWGPYAVSKAAVIALTQNMAAQFGSEGIRVNAIAPGVIATEATADRLTSAQFKATVLASMPLGKPGTVQDVAAATCYLASDEASQITAHVLALDGGQTATSYLNAEVSEAWMTTQN